MRTRTLPNFDDIGKKKNWPGGLESIRKSIINNHFNNTLYQTF